ncbi:MAG TPA: divergent polysaccharide deacetylase family protein [Thermoanaerobaculia bacterium]
MSGRESGSRGSSFRTLAVLMLLPITGLAIFFAWNWLNGGETPREAWREFRSETQGPPAPPVVAAAAGTRSSVPPVPRSSSGKPAEEPRGTLGTPRNRQAGGGEIVLIIDDLGFDGQPLERVMALDPNVNCSILPNGTRASEFARTLHARGFEILCHLPMEPMGKATPGRGAILTSMDNDEISRLTRENVEAVPHALGVNNHMGSRATSDRRVMQTVLGALPEGMYFIDSRTSGRSIAAEVARELNIRSATRHVFLDDEASEHAVRKQIGELAAAAEKHGRAIGIGHPYAVTLRVLAEELPELRARGFRLIRASEVVR